MDKKNSGWPSEIPTPENDSACHNTHLTKLCEVEKSEPVFSEPQEAQIISPPMVQRDNQGRFLTGNNGGGRKKGARNKLTETFIETIKEDFEAHGKAALEKLRESDPAMYLKMIAVLLPKSLIKDMEENVDYSDITQEELVEIIEKRQRTKEIKQLLNSVDKPR